MKDEFKRSMYTYIGIGGPKCPCCNDYFRKDKSKLNKLARKRLQNKDDKEFKHYK